MAKRDFHGVTEQAKASVHRRRDAQVLFEGQRWRGAMYLAGYAVECLLKVQLMRTFRTPTLGGLERRLTTNSRLPKRETVYTHELIVLLELTGAAQRLRRDQRNWELFNRVNRWVPAWRYSTDAANESDARDFLSDVDAISNWLRGNT